MDVNGVTFDAKLGFLLCCADTDELLMLFPLVINTSGLIAISTPSNVKES